MNQEESKLRNKSTGVDRLLIVDFLIFSSMRHSYPSFLARSEKQKADDNMAKIYGDAWERDKGKVIEWWGDELSEAVEEEKNACL
jgi:hypothetical protein